MLEANADCTRLSKREDIFKGISFCQDQGRQAQIMMLQSMQVPVLCSPMAGPLRISLARKRECGTAPNGLYSMLSVLKSALIWLLVNNVAEALCEKHPSYHFGPR